jgi:hypothetical protein
MRAICRVIVIVLFCVVHIASAQVPADTIRPGQITLHTPFLGTDTVDSYKIDGDDTTLTNTWIRTTGRAVAEAQPVFRIATTHVSHGSGDTTYNVLEVNPHDLALVRHDLRAPTDSAHAQCDTSAHVRGWSDMPSRGRHEIDVQYPAPVFPDDGIGPWLAGLLPLERHYAAVLPQFNLWSGGELYLTVKVVGDGPLNRGKLSFPCWLLEVSGRGGPPGYKTRWWISKTSRRLLQSVSRKTVSDPEYLAIMRRPF